MSRRQLEREHRPQFGRRLHSTSNQFSNPSSPRYVRIPGLLARSLHLLTLHQIRPRSSSHPMTVQSSASGQCTARIYVASVLAM
ncbi:hypothetical protein BD310DRAFT_940602 [Dichomitus squalens]|uniref:Uncharacterized protein n=1 Tax=Dichomitus squalens TaxID=114155 RepID=A0A4Q9PBW4_9APHY|nr:hypothetical protein BD310DRAFT_940602 [Dichomitus squalens]